VFREISVAEQRYQAVLAVLHDGLSVTAVAEKMGVSRQTPARRACISLLISDFSFRMIPDACSGDARPVFG
jgi:hypothetical protein